MSRSGRAARTSPGLILKIVVAALLLALVGAMAIEPTRQLLDQRRRVDEVASSVRRLERLNRGLEARIERLNDPNYIEQRAREQSGLVRPGEIAFVVMPPRRSRHEDTHRKPEARETPRPPGLLEGFLNFIGLL